MKKMFIKLFVLIFIFSAFFPLNIKAEEEIRDSLYEATTNLTRASKYITQYSVWLQNKGNGKLSVITTVYTMKPVTRIDVICKLEEFNEKTLSWKTVDTWDNYTKNKDYCDIVESYQGTIGNKYRVNATYTATSGSISETKEKITDYVYAVK